METEHTETVVEKVTSYVQHMFGIPRSGGDPDEKPEYEKITPALHFEPTAPRIPHTAAEPTTEDAMRSESGVFTTKTAAELKAESARRENGE